MHFTRALVAAMAMAVPLATAAPTIGDPARPIERRFVGDNGNVPSIYTRDTLEARGRVWDGVKEVAGGMKDHARNGKNRIRHKIGDVGQNVADHMYRDTATQEYAEVAARDLDEAADEEADEVADEMADEFGELEARNTLEPRFFRRKFRKLKDKVKKFFKGNRNKDAYANQDTSASQDTTADTTTTTDSYSEVAARDLDEAADEEADEVADEFGELEARNTLESRSLRRKFRKIKDKVKKFFKGNRNKDAYTSQDTSAGQDTTADTTTTDSYSEVAARDVYEAADEFADESGKLEAREPRLRTKLRKLKAKLKSALRGSGNKDAYASQDTYASQDGTADTTTTDSSSQVAARDVDETADEAADKFGELEARGRVRDGIKEIAGGMYDHASNAKARVKGKIGEWSQRVADKMNGGTTTGSYSDVAARDVHEAADELADESAQLEARAPFGSPNGRLQRGN
ncbi:hypothetical protein MAPG_11066 [Magnaporthiopsis poae ATCC 64411]|uniref:Uncharacterized protein n=1 Tax=Magnaporthiopsis poae (strain ATCC 64411 / 73-15) TaxID=644358 RepID=A0A0C4EE98_MAGP6|nr:hypothetical protein MAPG_11066 [Magnaporthiopsis poae ATCC 64411]